MQAGFGVPYMVGDPATPTDRFPTSRYPIRWLVTREPVSRLISSYLDKVYLPDFWRSQMEPALKATGLRGKGEKEGRQPLKTYILIGTYYYDPFQYSLIV